MKSMDEEIFLEQLVFNSFVRSFIHVMNLSSRLDSGVAKVNR